MRDSVVFEQRPCAIERNIVTAERRAGVSRDKGTGIQANCRITPHLFQRQSDQCLYAAEEDPGIGRSVAGSNDVGSSRRAGCNQWLSTFVPSKKSHRCLSHLTAEIRLGAPETLVKSMSDIMIIK